MFASKGKFRVSHPVDATSVGELICDDTVDVSISELEADDFCYPVDIGLCQWLSTGAFNILGRQELTRSLSEVLKSSPMCNRDPLPALTTLYVSPTGSGCWESSLRKEAGTLEFSPNDL